MSCRQEHHSRLIEILIYNANKYYAVKARQLSSKLVSPNSIGSAVDRVRQQHSQLQTWHRRRRWWTVRATTVNKSVSVKSSRYKRGDNGRTACSRCVRAKSVFFVYCSSMLPNCRWVRASTLGGGLKLKTAWRHWMHILIRFDVRKFSASPSKDRYQASCDDAIGRQVSGIGDELNKISF